MKKSQNISMRIFMLAVVAAAAALCSAQTKAIDKRGAMMFEGRPFITDSALYNSYDLGGSPLGLFEKGSPRFSALFGYRYGGLGDKAGQYWEAPVLSMGNPGRSFFQAFYTPDILSDKNGGNGVSLPLQRFGFAAATQDASGAMRASILFDGFYGKQEWKGGDSARVMMGVDRLRFDVGSRVHPWVRVGLYVGSKGWVDTLSAPGRVDRSAQINLPEFGVNVDVGGDDFPVRSNIDFSYAWSRFVYNIWTQSGGLPANYVLSAGPFTNDKMNAVRNDSLSLFWAVQARFQAEDGKLALRPGLIAGYTGNFGEMRVPDEPDNNIIEIGGARENSSYDLAGIWFGVGIGVEAPGYVDAHIEYTLAAMSLECGSYYTGAAADKSRTLHNFAVGVSSRVNNYVEMPVVVTPRAAWFISGATNAVGAARLRLGIDPLNAAPGMSKRALYEPQEFLGGFAHISGVTVGVDGQALEERLFASVWATFLSSKPKGGNEIGVKLGFNTK